MTEYILSEEETETIACAIRHYLQPQYLRITDVYNVIANREQVEEGIWAYNCPCQTVYLDDNAYAVDCGRQYVSRVYYNEHGEVLVNQQTMTLIEDPAPSEYETMTAKVYWDPREDITPLDPTYDGDQSIINALVYLGDYEWKRTEPGGGGIL